ncbi:MAG: HAMP domain-containing sensor histidine kinase [Dehalococcoidia bacterium]|nr:HAMP domain-containing sensor histidine kinase [Dehalococcoidia bacterium]
MRYQLVALALACVTAVAVAVGALFLWATLSGDGGDRETRAAEAELALLQAALDARAEGLRRGAEALIADQDVVAFAGTGGAVPGVLDGGRISRGGADYVLISGPGPRSVFEGGIADSLLVGATNASPAQLLLLQGAPDGAIFQFPGGPILAAGARTGPGTNAAAVVLGVRLDDTELQALAAPGRRVTLTWLEPDATPRTWLSAAPDRRVRIEGVVPLGHGEGILLATIDAPAQVVPGGVAGRAQTPFIAVVAGGALAVLSLLLLTRALGHGIGELRSALAVAGPSIEGLQPLEAIAGRDEVGRAAAEAVEAFGRTRALMDDAIDEARTATARQLLGEHVIRSMHEGVLVERSDTTCIVCNPAATLLLDVRAGDILGVRGGMAQVLGDDLYPRLLERAAADGGQRVELVAWAGRDLTFDAYLVPELRGEGHSLLVIIRDVSAVLEVEQLKRDVVSVVSHELRTPLTVIGSSLGMVNEAPPEMQRQLISTAERNVLRMRELVDDMLDLARLESGQAAPNLEPQSLVDICHEVASLLGPQAQAKGIRVLEATDGDLPAYLRCDRRQVSRAITNLVTNAIKFSPEQSDVWIVVRGEPEWVHIDVVDSGPGVPLEEHERVFTRFYRATNTRERVTGTGLGLPIVRQIAELHGGRAGLMQTEQGAYFRFSLPRSLGEA